MGINVYFSLNTIVFYYSITIFDNKRQAHIKHKIDNISGGPYRPSFTMVHIWPHGTSFMNGGPYRTFFTTDENFWPPLGFF